MKIAFVVHDFLNGVGHGRYCIELARQFAKDHEVHVLANRFEPQLEFSYTAHRVSAWRASALTSVLTFSSAAQKIIDRLDFDVVHAQGYSCMRADVITAHVCNAARYRRAPAVSFPKKLFPAFVIPREAAFYGASRGAQVIAISKVIQRELTDEYRISSEVIYHGVDTDLFCPGEPRSRNEWLFVGEAVKGLEEAMTALCAFPEARLKVVTRSELESWRAQARTLKLEKRIEFVGPSSSMPQIYRSAGLFIYPSNYDAFGMVVAEAMASELPVIVDERIGAAEWIKQGANGFLIEPNRPSSLLARIREAQSAGVGKAARQTALEHSWDVCARQTLAIYERAMASKRSRQ